MKKLAVAIILLALTSCSFGANKVDNTTVKTGEQKTSTPTEFNSNITLD